MFNRATQGGGGLAISSFSASRPAAAVIHECWFLGNVAFGATGGGGLFAIDAGGLVTIDRTTFSLNRADNVDSLGGGLLLVRSQMNLSRSTISGNLTNG